MKTVNPYSALGNDEFLLCLTQEFYAQLDEERKVMLLQEFENRQAAAVGRKPLQVVAKRMLSSTLGQCGNKVIHINMMSINGGRLRPPATIADMLATLIHEGRHAFQRHAVEAFVRDHPDTLPPDDVCLRWLINLISYHDMTNESYYVYAMQDVEVDARKEARLQLKTLHDKLVLLTGEAQPEYEVAYDSAVTLEKHVHQVFLEFYNPEYIDRLSIGDIDKFLSGPFQGICAMMGISVEEFIARFRDIDMNSIGWKTARALMNPDADEQPSLDELDKIDDTEHPRFYDSPPEQLDNPDLCSFHF